jgi:hypothetical protein
MKPTQRKRLALSTETLRTLSATELADINGGFTDISGSCLCNSFICSVFGNCQTAACPKGGTP